MRTNVAKKRYICTTMEKIQFQCDYNEGCHPRILEMLMASNMEQTEGYGMDPHCKRAKELILQACGLQKADVHFLVGGTQTNATVISATLRPHQGVVCCSTGHINVHETGAIEHGAHKVIALPEHDGKLDPAELSKMLELHYTSSSPEHEVQPGMVYISFPTELGTLYSKDELMAIRKSCDEYGLPLFVDGARLGYGLMSQECDITLKDLAVVADVFYIGGTKQGALFGEAVVINNEAIKKDFRYFIKQGGGLLAKGRLLGIQFEALFEDNLYFDLAAAADAKALKIRDALRAAGYSFLVESPTNQQFPILPDTVLKRLADRFLFSYQCRVDAGHSAVRICTSWATADASVDALIAALA